MNLLDLLPTRKVTAFVIGGALVLVALWLIVDVFARLEEWPPAFIVGALVILVGAIVAWTVPEGAWRRLNDQIDVEERIDGATGRGPVDPPAGPPSG